MAIPNSKTKTLPLLTTTHVIGSWQRDCHVAEGCARRTQREYVAFLNRAEASLEEAGYLLDFARRLSYLNEQEASKLLAVQDEAARTLRGLIARIRRDLAADA